MSTRAERGYTHTCGVRQASVRLRVRAKAILTLGLLAVATVVHAQEAVIEGQVVDQQDSALIGVTVVLRAGSLRTPSVVTTDERGEYRFLGLAPGVYTISVTL